MLLFSKNANAPARKRGGFPSLALEILIQEHLLRKPHALAPMATGIPQTSARPKGDPRS